jgi:hypothetical protein
MHTVFRFLDGNFLSLDKREVQRGVNRMTASAVGAKGYGKISHLAVSHIDEQAVILYEMLPPL